MDPEERDNLVTQIEMCIPEPGGEGYLLSSKFVQKLRTLKPSDRLPKITNSDLKQAGRLKTTLKSEQDYYVIDDQLWHELEYNFGGGPPITCRILSNGAPELFPLQFNVKYRDRSGDFVCSREDPIEDLFNKIALYFQIDGEDWSLYPLNCPGEIPRTGGVVGQLLTGQKRLEIRPTSTESPKPSQASPVRATRKPPSNPVDNSKQKTNDTVSTGSKAPPGLRNLGNSCYMNASLQALHCFDYFSQNVATAVSEADQPRLTPVFARLFEQMNERGQIINPQTFKTAIGAILPFLKGKTQEDSHEFTTFLLDILNEECSKKNGIVNSLFYGKLQNEMICSHCNHSRIITEAFSSISLAVAQSRRVIFSPYDLLQPMQRVCVVPDVPSLLIGKTHDGKNSITTVMRPEFVELFVLEAPPLDPGIAYAITRVTGGKAATTPFLVQVPLDISLSEEEIRDIVVARIKPLVPGKLKNVELVAPPNKFTYDPAKGCCSQPLTVKINQKLLPIRSVPQTGPIPVEELVERYFSEVVLDPDNQWKCEACDTETCALHRMSLVQCPKNLIIQLKRFRVRGAGYVRDDSEVIVPNELDLGKFITTQGSSTKYELKAIVNHSGTLGGGHYTANGKRNGEWYYFNDASVTQRPPPSTPTSAAYVLYYERVE